MSRVVLAATMVAALVPSVILHEIAHAYTADHFGDGTARRAGRVSFNPIRHVDPLGSLVVPGLMVLFVPFVVAWAKPVPVLQANLRTPRLHSVWVALAGPATNFALAGFGLLATRVLQPQSGSWLWTFLAMATVVNVLLGVLNLLPIPPLDGSAIIEFALPRPALACWHRVRPFTMVPLVVLLVLGRDYYEPVVDWAVDLWSNQQ
jgi:Zn-dependent protease